VTALISEREVFGMAVLESLACGTPALVLDDGWGPSDIINSATGVRTAADEAEVGQALLDALALSWQPDTASACRAVAEGYDWRRRIAPRLVEVYADHD
jgi:alpha-1,6-mannosyltransferase